MWRVHCENGFFSESEEKSILYVCVERVVRCEWYDGLQDQRDISSFGFADFPTDSFLF